MNVVYRKTFLKELARVPKKTRIRIEVFVFTDVPQSSTIQHTQKIERLKGYKDYFKARFGIYRVGMRLKDDVLVFERVLHRRDIYRYFP